MSYVKELHAKIEQLQDGFDLQALEIVVVKNELQDTMEVSILVDRLTQHILQMFLEYCEFIKNRTETDVHKKSRKRLVELLDISTALSHKTVDNQTLKLLNKHMVGTVHKLRLENSELRLKIENMIKAEKF